MTGLHKTPEQENLDLMHKLEEWGVPRMVTASYLKNNAGNDIEKRYELLKALNDVAKRVETATKAGMVVEVEVITGNNLDKIIKVLRTTPIVELMEMAVDQFGLSPNAAYDLRYPDLQQPIYLSQCVEDLKSHTLILVTI